MLLKSHFIKQIKAYFIFHGGNFHIKQLLPIVSLLRKQEPTTFLFLEISLIKKITGFRFIVAYSVFAQNWFTLSKFCFVLMIICDFFNTSIHEVFRIKLEVKAKILLKNIYQVYKNANKDTLKWCTMYKTTDKVYFKTCQ